MAWSDSELVPIYEFVSYRGSSEILCVKIVVNAGRVDQMYARTLNIDKFRRITKHSMQCYNGYVTFQYRLSAKPSPGI